MSSIGIESKRIIEEIQQNRVELKNAIEASEARIQLRIEESNERIRQLETENSILKLEIEKLERQQKKGNIVIFGLNKERHEITFDVIRNELKSLLQIDVSLNQIKDIYSLGSSKNSPVKVEFASNITKKQVFANCKKLKGTGISISQDLTTRQREELAVLKRHLQTHKQNKNENAYIKGNKLVVNKIEYTVQQLLDFEGGKDEGTKSRSVPSTPTQPLLRGLDEEETTKPVTPSTKPSGANKKLISNQTPGQNLGKIKTRLTSEREKKNKNLN
ncbi:hypothetical protein JTB14_028122 [Gonioctena quinquepunctata]|nr:hypothetical protein JTB14_028122 [Gonioctena quinquepunctata]